MLIKKRSHTNEATRDGEGVREPSASTCSPKHFSSPFSQFGLHSSPDPATEWLGNPRSSQVSLCLTAFSRYLKAKFIRFRTLYNVLIWYNFFHSFQPFWRTRNPRKLADFWAENPQKLPKLRIHWTSVRSRGWTGSPSFLKPLRWTLLRFVLNGENNKIRLS